MVQTPPIKTPEQVTYTLIDWYLHVPCTRKETLQRLANYVVADAYFSKSTFVDGALEMGFHVISRFRGDAYFRYLITEIPIIRLFSPLANPLDELVEQIRCF